MKREQTAGIRRARPSDRETVVDLLEAEDLASAFVPDEFLVACEGDEILACARLTPLGGGHRELASVVVRPDRRGEGIGTALVERALRGLEDPVHALAMQPGFFEELGFVARDEVPPRLEAKARACCADRDVVPMVWRSQG